jgi:hypothetical protein
MASLLWQGVDPVHPATVALLDNALSDRRDLKLQQAVPGSTSDWGRRASRMVLHSPRSDGGSSHAHRKRDLIVP